jgi:hypothetical protein
MDTAILIPVLLWLGVVSWFDIREHEIPHSAWVIIPLVLAIIYQGVLENWSLVLFAVLISLISERQFLARFTRAIPIMSVRTWLPILIVSLLWSVQSFPIATLSILAFWIAWEFGWWGGADATTAICLFLLLPAAGLLFGFVLVHLITVLTLAVHSWITTKKFQIHRVPGLPLLLISTLVVAYLS